MDAKESVRRKIFEFFNKDNAPTVGIVKPHRNSLNLSVEEHGYYELVVRELIDAGLLSTIPREGKVNLPYLTAKGLQEIYKL